MTRSTPHLHTIHLPFGQHPRRIRWYAPIGAERPPLLLLFDGQNVFDDAGSFAGGWYAHDAVDGLPGTVRRPVVVAVDHGGVRRNRELWTDLDRTLGFVLERVLPAVRREVGAVDVPRTVIGGASMGGLAAFAALLRHPDVFGAAMVMSPSLWVGQGVVFRELHARGFPPNGRIYLDVGLRERGQMAPLATHLSELLGPTTGERLMWRPDRRGNHRERHWRRRLPKALRFLFHRDAIG